ncbi:MAG: multicopper oxidase family protein [Rhodospirillales bacterium]|nr:multicopper oxidase family protein [Rhodospirillales bacterium]
MFVSRRRFIAGATGFAGASLIPWPGPARAAAPVEASLVLAPARAALAGAGHPQTAVWAFNGETPGPVLRFRQGDRARIAVENRLAEETTIHWHGIRVPNAMDGVPHLTQPPIPPGGRFVYEFDLPDAGTYWYHPHANSAEQIGRGLAGALIVAETAPPAVDRDLVWVLADWRLDRQAQIVGDFHDFRDMAHAGRLGNTVTVNGRVPERVAVRAGERLRLRLVNAASARIFGLDFAGHAPWIVALDGQPVDPHRPADGQIVLGPGERVDLALDCAGAPGASFAVTDRFYPRTAYKLLDLAYSDASPLRAALPPPLRLADNPWRRPDPAKAARHRVTIEGGMMGGLRLARLDGRSLGPRELMRHGKAWAINGEVAGSGHPEPMLTLARGESAILELVNDTAWPHPMHIHGMFLDVLSREGAPVARREGRDTLLLLARAKADVALRADEPGDWMFHCHILDHQDGGLMGIIRVV